MTKPLTIGALAKSTDTKVETIRWYEKVGLLSPPARSGGNYRVYDEAALKRLSFIRRARALGFSLDDVRSLLTLAADTNGDCATADQLARTQLQAVDCKLADLAALRSELELLVQSCGGGAVRDCRIIEALAPR